MILKFSTLILISSFIMFSCRGTTMKTPPIHIIQNMDNFGKLDPQSSNLASYRVSEEPFEDLNDNHHWDKGEPFEDLNNNHHWDDAYTEYINENKMSMNQAVEGTIYRENNSFLITDSEVNQLNVENTGMRAGKFIKSIPSNYIDNNFIERGQERYNIYCSVCHGISGDGDGMVMNKNYSWNKNTKPANLQDLRDKDDSCKDGYLFDVISNGKGNMKGYSQQISVEDRWKIVGYVRALSIANGVDIQCCDMDDFQDLKENLKAMSSIEEKLLSDEFKCLIELGQVQKIMKNEMIEIQQTVNCDAFDGKWGGGTLNKWKKWREEISK